MSHHHIHVAYPDKPNRDIPFAESPSHVNANFRSFYLLATQLEDEGAGKVPSAGNIPERVGDSRRLHLLGAELAALIDAYDGQLIEQQLLEPDKASYEMEPFRVLATRLKAM